MRTPRGADSLLLIGKWGGLANNRSAMHVLPFLVLIYTALSFLANWEVGSRWMILVPYYALFQALVVPVFGAFYYLVLWHRTGSWAPPGRYRISFRRETLPAEATS